MMEASRKRISTPLYDFAGRQFQAMTALIVCISERTGTSWHPAPRLDPKAAGARLVEDKEAGSL